MTSSSLSVWRSYGLGILVSLVCGILTPPLILQLHAALSFLLVQFSWLSSRMASKIPIVPVTFTVQEVFRKDDPTVFKFIPCHRQHLSQFLHDDPVPGIHILCFGYEFEDSDTDTDTDSDSDSIMSRSQNNYNNDTDAFSVRIYSQSYEPHGKTISKSSNTNKKDFKNKNDSSSSWRKFIMDTVVTQHLHISPHTQTNTQPWAIFTTTGDRIVGELDDNYEDDHHGHDQYHPKQSHRNPWETLKQHGMVLLFEGGNFMWPGVRIGFKRTVQVHSGYTNTSSRQLEIDREIQMETLSLRPLVLSVQNFISMEECDHIQKMAMPYMQYSQVTLMDKDAGRPASDFRTSQSTFLPAKKDMILNALEIRTASLTKVPKHHQEDTQVLRYSKGERYTAHLDWFDPQQYQNDPTTLNQLIQYGKRNRLATVFWYLSDVPQGGETSFPRFNNGPHPRDFVSNVWCDNGGSSLKVKPEKGKVIVFYSLLADGTGDPLSLHGACPVEEGIKWAANKWVWNAPMGFVS